MGILPNSFPFRALCLSILGAWAVQGCWDGVRAADSGGRLRSLFDEYRLVTSVSLTARVQLRFHVPVLDGHLRRRKKSRLVKGDSKISFHAQGNEFASSDSVPPGVAVWNFRSAYNGKRYECLDGGSGYLFYQKHRWPSSHLMSPNPFFAAVEFLDPSRDGHPNRAIRLPVVRSANAASTAIAKATWVAVAKNSRYSAIAQIPFRGTVNGHRAFWRVKFGRKVAFLPEVVETVYAKTGAWCRRGDILAYKAIATSGGKFYCPMVFRWRFRGRHGNLYADHLTKVVSCTINQPIGPAAFQIDFRLARQIYDADAHRTIYYEGGVRPPQRVIGIKSWPAGSLGAGGALANASGQRAKARNGVASGLPPVAATGKPRDALLAVIFGFLAVASGLVLILSRKNQRASEGRK